VKGKLIALNREQAVAIMEEAHLQGFGSIALVQALQFECKFLQKDVIGEWVPISEPGPETDVRYRNQKWRRGIRWEEIDSNLVLRHAPSLSGEIVTTPLAKFPLVKAEFDRIERKSSGPLIAREGTSGIPWMGGEFRRKWREIARMVGVDDNVKNRTSKDGDDEEEDDMAGDWKEAAE
jgi:hypothetical protein